MDFKIQNNSLVCDYIDAQLQKKGMQLKWAKRFRQNLIEDWNKCSLPIEKKIWAVEHGFYPSRIQLYGLTEQNVSQYLSDLDYMRIHPINNHFAFWINDKITLKNIFANSIKSFSKPDVLYNLMPEYYLYIENNGYYSYLMDSPADLQHNSSYIFNLLKKKKTLALKPSNGAGGVGFIKLEYSNDKILWNDMLISHNDLLKKIETLKGYIVTEYLKQHNDFNSICNKSACTLRVIVVKTTDDKYSGGHWNIISSFARFGTEKSNGTCNMHNGAVAISYNPDTGDYGNYFYRYKGFAENDQTFFLEHPDSKIILKGKKLPRYKEVKDVVLTACGYLSSLEYFGVDVVITNKDIKILEINSLPVITTTQVMFGPLLANPKASKFFNKKLNNE